MNKTETQRLLEKLKKLGTSFSYLAYRLDVAENTVRNYHNGSSEPGEPALKVLRGIYHRAEKSHKDKK